jgi:hypothetical protein
VTASKPTSVSKRLLSGRKVGGGHAHSVMRGGCSKLIPAGGRFVHPAWVRHRKARPRHLASAEEQR